MALLLLLLTAALVGGMVACGGQPDAADAIGTVKRHLDAMKNDDHDAWSSTMTRDAKTGLARESGGEFGVISLAVHEVAISDEETRRMKERYSGSELARDLGWSDEYISANMIVVSTRYTVDYDNTKVPFNEGALTQDFILVRNDEPSEWLIWDASSPSD